MLDNCEKATGCVCRRKEHDKQVQQLQQQLHAAEEEHRNMQSRLEVSVKAAAVKEAEAAAAAKAEQAALKAAACATQQSQAAVAAATGAQPHMSCPGFQPLPQQQQQPLQLSAQQVRQEFEGQQLLNTAAAAAQSSDHQHGWLQNYEGRTSSRIAFGPPRDCSPTYAARMRDMQDHIDALTRSLSQNRRNSPKRQRGHKGHKHSSRDKLQADQHSKKARSSTPAVPQGIVQSSVLDLFDSEAESAEETGNSGRSSDADACSSDR